MKASPVRYLSALLVGGWLCIPGSVARGQFARLTVLTNFNGTDGAYPFETLTLGKDGNFYGTTEAGGTNGEGTVFKVTTNGTLTSLYSFSPLVSNGSIGTNDTGAVPDAPLAPGMDGNLYGATDRGGTNGYGTLFKVTTNGTVTAFVTFHQTNGANPTVGALVQVPDGNFYGATINGGTNNAGTVFKVTTNGTLTSLYSFSALVTNGGLASNAEGAKPVGLTLGMDGSLYGLAASGGTNGEGTAFKITTNGTPTLLATFSPLVSNGNIGTNNNGAIPANPMTLMPDGNFYGTTGLGGTGGAGTVFKLTTNGMLTTLFSFDPLVSNGSTGTNADGAQTAGVLTPGPDGSLFGTGSNGGSNGVGELFQITTNGVFTPLLAFSARILNGGVLTNATGAFPTGLILANDGSFYGTGYKGGANSYGNIFKVTVAPPLNLQSFPGKAVLSWTNSEFSLQSAPTVTNTFTNIPGATSPFTNTISVGQQFFRLVGT